MVGIYIQTIFWKLPTLFNQLLNHSAGPAIAIRLISTILWDVFHPSKDAEYLNFILRTFECAF